MLLILSLVVAIVVCRRRSWCLRSQLVVGGEELYFEFVKSAKEKNRTERKINDQLKRAGNDRNEPYQTSDFGRVSTFEAGSPTFPPFFIPLLIYLRVTLY